MKRDLALDILRGITIFGMVFSAIIPSEVLPAWMYHIQTPPPTHELNMLQAGLSWVDLVFPAFIFCMGVAIPLSGERRVARGITDGQYLGKVFIRFLRLWLFAYLCTILNFSSNPDPIAQVLTLASFVALSLLYIKRHRGMSFRRLVAMRVIGASIAVMILGLGSMLFDTRITVERRSIIIFLLAFLYLFGSTIWYLTRGNRSFRALIFALLFLFTLLTQQFDLQQDLYADNSIRWWFNMEEIYYLLLLIPATFIGDFMYKIHVRESRVKTKVRKFRRGFFHAATSAAVTLSLLGIIIWTVWFLYKLYSPGVVEELAVLLPSVKLGTSRLITCNIIFTILVLFAIAPTLFTTMPKFRGIYITASVMLVWGLFIDPLDDGIKKVPCTISYCFVTFALSGFMLIICSRIGRLFGNIFPINIFSESGVNPLMSFVAYYMLVLPVLNLTGLMPIIVEHTQTPALGVIRAAILVLISMAIVSLFTRHKFVWKA